MPSRLTAFQGCVRAALVAATIVMPGRNAHAQSLEPRSYVNTPTGINFLLLGYGYTQGEVGFDASTPITDARVHVHAGVLAYARSLDLWGLSGKVLGVLPVADVSGSAKARGQDVERDVLGLGDPLLRLSVNFFGAPALSMDEYATYEQDVIVGASLQVTAPLGQYDSNKLLNVGTNRWSIKPELGVSKAWGAVTLEVIQRALESGVRKVLDGLAGLRIEVLQVSGPGPFRNINTPGGRTTIDGEKGERLENVRLGLTTSLSLTRHQSIKLFGSAGVYHRTENNFWAVGLAWQFRWGGGL